jgi:hypothetical protein
MKPVAKKDQPDVAGGRMPELVYDPELEGPIGPRPPTDTQPVLPDPPQPD